MPLIDSLQKDDRSPVTIADFASQAVICQHLQSSFPDDRVVAEEDSEGLSRSENATLLRQVTAYVQRQYPDASPSQVCSWIDHGMADTGLRFWALDPIDGTKGFLRNDQYAIALALLENGEPQVAVLGCPALPFDMESPDGRRGVLFWAVRGHGAFIRHLGDDADLRVHVTSQDGRTPLRFLESVDSSHGDPDLQEAVVRSLPGNYPRLRMDSQAKYGLVSRGDASLYLRFPSPRQPDYRERIWDHAAGVLLVEEAGGRVSDMFGGQLDLVSNQQMLNNVGVIVTNGTLHDTVLDAVQRALANRRPIQEQCA